MQQHESCPPKESDQASVPLKGSGKECDQLLNQDIQCIPLNDVPSKTHNENLLKKKKKKKKKKNIKLNDLPEQDNSMFRCLNNWPSVKDSCQTDPPTIPIINMFPDKIFPLGEIQQYVGSNVYRTTDEEKRHVDKLFEEDYQDIRCAAECHRQVRKYAQSYCRPGMSMIDICQRLEAKTKELILASGLQCGYGFPTGCSINHVAAHYTPNYGDMTILNYEDVVKLDFGVHVRGRIIDSAFTIAFDPKYDNLVQATKDATNAGIREAGIDVKISEVSAIIQETIESYEIELNGKFIPIKPVANLNGHSILPYQIHGGKSVPIVRTTLSDIMEENEVYAIETFASTGLGRVIESGECSHYMKDYEKGFVSLRLKNSKSLLHAIEQNFGTLAFCRRWLDDIGQTRHLIALKNLVESEVIVPYPPLVDCKNSYVSQMEHTILLRPTCKEVVSRGCDY
ncbi:uncharacterized protein LOC128882912 isoform X2 [Hylaeus volcanicus]|uniref:uncharacterized protein LOC128882912 isoform X2 n=1 Tax=Hylaeus volcanicus TaxID=313075 RepID=UPI0023B8508C|nr:uncharacterized protein LOC128882912 isoform X2 [Hylaeus volcanicus]